MTKKIIAFTSVVTILLLGFSLVLDKVYEKKLETLKANHLFTTEKELVTYLFDAYGIRLKVTNSNKVIGSMSFDKTDTGLGITVNVDSICGYASEVGMKNVSIRAFTSGTSYVAQSAEAFHSTNTFTSSGGYTITDPVAGKAYQIVGTLYTIINGVEYTYYVESSKHTF